LEIGETMTTQLYALWLPITDFDEFYKSLKLSDLVINHNSNWSWITFHHNNVDFTMDSLGFVYLDGVTKENLEDSLSFITQHLNKKTKVNIQNTFLNKSIGYIEEEHSSKEAELLNFMLKIVTFFPQLSNKLLFEEVSTSLFCKEKVFLDTNELKFSLKDKIDSFQTILNRNFQNMLKKSIYFTHGLNFEKGELYELSIVDNVYNSMEKELLNLTLHLEINGQSHAHQKEALFKQIIKKIIQDTIEERVILNFLKVTKTEYLRNIINEIAINNEILKKLNSYLLEDLKEENTKYQKMKDLDDESATEIFIQNLLQVIPKFHMMDTKIQEAYYIKVGNSTTNLNVKKDETILNTLYYRKWKASIDFFIETASKAKESLGMYHKNKTLKELEDISYNANYQADIEDIRELQKNKALLLDEETKKILFLVAIITLTGEAPLIPFPEIKSILSNIFYMGVNFLLYSFLLYTIVIPYIRGRKNDKTFLEVGKTFLRYLKEKVFKRDIEVKKESKVKAHTFEESDYDKHELRSSRSLYTYNESSQSYEKISISYNNLISAYGLVEKLKKVNLTQDTKIGLFSFDLFPKLLRDVPISNEEKHIYRENYRISGNDRVATKIMYRYKLSELKLSTLLEEMKKDSFMNSYAEYLSDEEAAKFSIEKAIENLKPHADYEEESQVTLYIVYSFVLKFYSLDSKNKNIFNYTISKDQFRVHYHINILDYDDAKDFEKKQTNLAKLIDVYFLKRLKRFKEVRLN